jgi:hypothetical protein
MRLSLTKSEKILGLIENCKRIPTQETHLCIVSPPHHPPFNPPLCIVLCFMSHSQPKQQAQDASLLKSSKGRGGGSSAPQGNGKAGGAQSPRSQTKSYPYLHSSLSYNHTRFISPHFLAISLHIPFTLSRSDATFTRIDNITHSCTTITYYTSYTL